MNDGTPPQGWDDDIPPDTLAGARDVRVTFLALVAAGFTRDDAAVVIAHWMVATNAASTSLGPT